MTESGDTGCERATQVGVDKRKFGSLVEVLVVHVVNQVQGVYINTCKPFHHVLEARHEFFIGDDVALYRAVGRAALLACPAVDPSADGIVETLGKVRTCAEELHFLSRLGS